MEERSIRMNRNQRIPTTVLQRIHWVWRARRRAQACRRQCADLFRVGHQSEIPGQTSSPSIRTWCERLVDFCASHARLVVSVAPNQQEWSQTKSPRWPRRSAKPSQLKSPARGLPARRSGVCSGPLPHWPRFAHQRAGPRRRNAGWSSRTQAPAMPNPCNWPAGGSRWFASPAAVKII